MERFLKYAFPLSQCCFHLCVRGHHNDLRKYIASIQPSRAQMAQEVCHFSSAEETQIEENQRGVISWQGLFSPGEGCVPISTNRRAIPRQLQHPTQHLLERWLLLGNQDVRCARDGLCFEKDCTLLGVVTVVIHHLPCFLRSEMRANLAECSVSPSGRKYPLRISLVLQCHLEAKSGRMLQRGEADDHRRTRRTG